MIVSLGLLGGCGPRDTYVSSTANFVGAGHWRIERQIDRITAAPITSAQTITQESSHSGVVGSRPASLQLTCFESKPVVRIAFDFKIGSDKNTTMGYRFDAKPGRDDVDSRVLIGYQVIVIENKAAVEHFVADLIGSTMLYVRLRSLNGGRSTAEFKVDGGATAVEAAFAGCPLAPEPTRRTS